MYGNREMTAFIQPCMDVTCDRTVHFYGSVAQYLSICYTKAQQNMLLWMVYKSVNSILMFKWHKNVVHHIFSNNWMVYLAALNRSVVANSMLNWTMWENVKYFKSKREVVMWKKSKYTFGIQNHLAFAKSLIYSGLTIYNIMTPRLFMGEMCRFTLWLHCPWRFAEPRSQGCAVAGSHIHAPAITLRIIAKIHPIARSRYVK